jgi:hypothetical protein
MHPNNQQPLGQSPVSPNESQEIKKPKKYWFIHDGSNYLRSTSERMMGLRNTSWAILRPWRPISWQGHFIKFIFPFLFFVPFVLILSIRITKVTGILYATLIGLLVIGIFVVYYKKVDKSIINELEKLEKNHLTPISNVKDSIIMLVIALTVVGLIVYKLNMF